MRHAFWLSDAAPQPPGLSPASARWRCPPLAARGGETESPPCGPLRPLGAPCLTGLFATVDRGRGHKGGTAFLVEPTFPGFALGKLERKMGVRGSPTVAIHLADCEVPVENRLGNEGEGFRVALGALDRSRPAVGAQAVGIAQAPLDAPVGYAKERRPFGQPIATFQGIQFMLAGMAMALPASRLTV